MKCPKCDYLGFDTGARCKNCGYDFSLIAPVEPEPADADRTRIEPMDHTPAARAWLEQLDRVLATPVTPVAAQPPAFLIERESESQPEPLQAPAVPPASPTAGSSRARGGLPLFAAPLDDDDDEPLIRLPAAPRPPLAVRKTPELPRLRAVPKTAPRVEEPVLQFADEGAPDLDLQLRDLPPIDAARRTQQPVFLDHAGPSPAGARLGAAGIDHLILCAVDAAVVYFTLRMAGLAPADWQLLPPAPLLTFLVLVKFAYFVAFTAVGGQTIGKMAFNLQVVTDDAARVDAVRALRRTSAGVLSSLVLGLGFIPALVGSDRRTLHDRVARTRVIALRSA